MQLYLNILYVYMNELLDGRQVLSSFAVQGHLDEARAMQAKMPPAARPLLLSSVACNLYLQALESSDFNLFSPALQKGGYSPLRYQLQIKWHVMRGKY